MKAIEAFREHAKPTVSSIAKAINDQLFWHIRQHAKPRMRGSAILLVDAENISARFFPQVYEATKRVAHVREVRIYGPRSLLASEPWSIIKDYYRAHQVECLGCRAGKNSSDIRLAVDAMDLLMQGKTKAIALASDDTDFAPLAHRLRSSGLRVIGISRLSRNEAYKQAFSEFISIGGVNPYGNESHMDDTLDKAVSKSAARCGIDNRTLALTIHCASRIADGKSWCSATELGSLIKQELPGFSYRQYGCKSLTKYIQRTGLFDVRRENNNTYFRLKANRVAP